MSQKSSSMQIAEQLSDMSSRFKTPSHERGVCNSAIEELRRLHAENEALKANHKIVGYTTKPITWTSERHHSEQIMKITQRAQPEHGFVHPVYAVCNSVEHDHA